MRIGQQKKPFTIAEVGINHNGDLSLAKEMIHAAQEAGADAVKFQTFKASEFCADHSQLFTYQSQGKTFTEPMLTMFSRYEFTFEQWRELSDFAKKAGILFFSTPQNLTDLDMLIELKVPIVKVGSDDFTNLPMLRKYSQRGLPLILSSGMSNLAEIHDALNITGFFSGQDLTLLLCTSLYPTPLEEVHLHRITTLKQAFPGLRVGFSDHTQGHLAASLAVALGAEVFEKHFTMDRNFEGPDHWFSENPKTLKDWVDAIQDAHTLLGEPWLKPTAKELENKREFQRVLVAKVTITIGEEFTEQNLTMMRKAGGNGLKPKMMFSLLGKKSWKTFERGEAITF